MAGCEGAVETGGEFFPSGFAVVAAMRAFILKLAAERVFRAAVRRPVQVGLRR